MAHSSKQKIQQGKTHSPKAHFIETLMHAGEMRLAQADATGLELFETAANLDPNNPQMMYRQGLAIFDYASNEHPKCLLLANKKFKKALAFDKAFFEGWLSWGNTLLLLGNKTSKHHYYIESKEKFEKALVLARGQSPEMLLDLYWNYGLATMRVASKSGEALDFHLARESFDKASLLKEDLPANFWCDFGHLDMCLAHSLGDTRYLMSAIEHYKKACMDVADHSAWIYLGNAITEAYLSSHEEDHFEQASECFSAASAICDTDSSIWVKWAHLLLVAGRQLQDVKILHTAVEKCQKAKSLGGDTIELQCIYAETLAAIGSLKNRLKNLKRSEEIMSDLCERHPKNPMVHVSYGIALLALAEYFDCLDTYFLAIEQFQSALSIDRSLHVAWHAMGSAYLTIAPMEDDPELQTKRAVRFFTKALELNNDPIYHFDLGQSYLELADEEPEHLKSALYHFESALSMQKNAYYLYPQWLFAYAKALTLSGEINDSHTHLEKALDLLEHIQALQPDYPDLHYRFALCYSALAELGGSEKLYATATHHYRIAQRHDSDDDDLLIDWALNLMHWSEHVIDPSALLADAHRKLISAAKLGNASAYYTLAGLCASQSQNERALFYLARAHKFDALPPIDEIVDDEWLENLHNTPDFQSFIVTIEQSN